MAASVPEQLRAFAAEFDRRFEACLEPVDDVPAELTEAIHYSALTPGKRIRPYLVTRCCKLVGGDLTDAWPAAVAVECVHTFSLIHDDLPAMDDDDLRRGRPTCHKQFGEATAILAGDALVMLAFETLVGQVADGARASRMVFELAKGAGWGGMIGGQAADMYGESRPPTLELVRCIHQQKTARLFETACRLGVMAAGGETDVLAYLGRYGRMLGQAFQIADDLLDLSSTPGMLGKNVSKDARANKQTFPRCVGKEESQAAATEAVDAAIAELDSFGADAEDLRALAVYVIDRNY